MCTCTHVNRSHHFSNTQVAALVEGLKEENIHVGCGAQSSSYVRSKKDVPISEGENYQHFSDMAFSTLTTQTTTLHMLVVLFVIIYLLLWVKCCLTNTSKLHHTLTRIKNLNNFSGAQRIENGLVMRTQVYHLLRCIFYFLFLVLL